MSASQLRPQDVLPPEQLRRLCRISSPVHSACALAVIAVAVLCAAISSGCLLRRFFGDENGPAVYVWLPCAALQGCCHLAFIILYHDIVHRACLPWEGRFWPAIYGLLTPFSPAQYRRWHLDHHAHLGNERMDPKRAHFSPPPSPNRRWVKWLYFTPILIAIYGRAASDAERHHQYPGRPQRQIKRERIRSFGLHSFIVIGMIAIDPAMWARVHLVPLGIFFPLAFGINRVGQHYHCRNTKEERAKGAKTENNVIPGFLLTGSRVDGNLFWHIVFLNSNYHLEHHVFPSVPFYRIGTINRLLQPLYEKHRIRDFGYGELLYLWLGQNAVPHVNWDDLSSEFLDCKGRGNDVVPFKTWNHLLAVSLEMSRPKTAIPVILSVISGVGRAVGFSINHTINDIDVYHVGRNTIFLLIAAILLNCASNVLNQITDTVSDAINKPHRPIVSGRVSIYQATVTSLILFTSSLVLSWQVVPPSLIDLDGDLSHHFQLRQHQTFAIFAITTLLTVAYSLPALGRLKANAVTASGAIAVARGLLLSTVGSTAVLDMLPGGRLGQRGFFSEAWILGCILAIYLFGASVTKDFSDIRGDIADGCFTFPALYGKRGAVGIIAPFFVVPWVALWACSAHLSGSTSFLRFTAGSALLSSLGALGSLCSGVKTSRKGNDFVQIRENHISWIFMYGTVVIFHLSTCAAYYFCPQLTNMTFWHQRM